VEQTKQFSFPTLFGNGAQKPEPDDSSHLSGIELDIENVSKVYETKKSKIQALQPMNLKIKPSSKVVFLGPSGSGKTTLLRLISGLETPSTGHILYDGVDVTNMSVQDRNLGFVFQNYALFKHMTVAENIAFGLRIRKLEIDPKKRVAELLKLVELEGYENKMPKKLSGGQRQRVAMARALACSPRLLLLDEPFGALDVVIRRTLRNSLKEITNQLNLTALMVTHDQEEAFDVADEVVVFNRGRIEQIGTPDEIQDNPQTPFVMNFIGDVDTVSAKSLIARRLRFKTDKSMVMMRPKDVVVSTEMQSDYFCPATVADRYDMGYAIKYILRFDDDEEIEIFATREEAVTTKSFSVLNRVYVSVDPSKMMGYSPEEIEYFR